MALRDHINELLAATPADLVNRRTALNDILNAVGADAADEDIVQAVAALIAEREQKAGSFAQAGQFDHAKRVREEIAALREVLRQVQVPETDKPAKPVVIPQAAKPEAPAEGKSMFTRRQTVMAALAGGVVVIAAIAWIAIGWTGSGSSGNGSTSQQATLYEDDHVMGNPKAPLVVIEYAAPSCPHCGQFFTTAFPTLKKEYIDTGKVYYVFRVLPIMPSDGAAEAIARCLPADKYFAFLDHLFRNQEKWDPEYGITDVRGALVRLSRVAGLSATQVDACIANQSVLDRMNEIAQKGADQYDLHAVPSFIIGGEKWKTGNVTWPEFKEKLDSELAKKK